MLRVTAARNQILDIGGLAFGQGLAGPVQLGEDQVVSWNPQRLQRLLNR